MQLEPFQPDELQLLNAIHYSPRSDTPRLAYADWLERRGERTLAGFIRIQCAKPYFSLDKQGSASANVSVNTWQIEFGDPERTTNAIQLLNQLHPGVRFPDPRLWQEYTRGLPLYEIKLDDDAFDLSVDHICGLRSPLARYRVFLHTCRLPEWLSHPILPLTEEFCVFPIVSRDTFENREFTTSDIRLLANSDIPDRLEKIGLSGQVAPEARALARDVLAPRVQIDYSY